MAFLLAMNNFVMVLIDEHTGIPYSQTRMSYSQTGMSVLRVKNQIRVWAYMPISGSTDIPVCAKGEEAKMSVPPNGDQF